MKANRLKNRISYFLLALMLASKLVGLHVLAHEDDPNCKDHCAICHNIASDSHHVATLNGTSDEVPKPSALPVYLGVIQGCDHQITLSVSPSLLFSRPPPIA